MPGQRPASLRRIGFLEATIATARVEPFCEGMRELGYFEVQNLVIEYRGFQGNRGRLPALAAELVGLQVEVIVASNVVAALAASQATSGIPIVVAGGNSVAAGLVSNVSHPEGNVTGVTTNSVEAAGKWIELLKETTRTISRLAAVADPGAPAAQTFLPVVERAAHTLQLQLTRHDLRDLDKVSTFYDRADSLPGQAALLFAKGFPPLFDQRDS